MFNRDNVSLVDVRAAPIIGYTETGLRTAAADYDLDVIVTATGFDAVTGAMTSIDIEGLDQRKLVDKWANGPTTYLGAMVAGFPNLFMIHGPMTPAALAQMITTGEWQVNWVADIIADMDRRGLVRIDATEAGEQWWADEVAGASAGTVHRLADSWYNGRNIEGKRGGFVIYVGGFPRYSELCNAAVREDYKGFALA
jgi:cation diffusion facilitator CzcD-associated flavoprotein CzcO